LLQRVATRLSLRKVKKEEKVDKKQEEEKKEEVGEKKEEKEEKTESEVVNNGQQESVLHNDETKVGVKEPANEVPTDAGKVSEKGKKKKTKKKKEENEKDEKYEKEEKGGEEEEKEEGVMQRLKSRLSMRGKKKEKINASDQEKECNGTNKEAEKEEKVEKNGKEKEAKEDPVVEEKKWVSGSKETGEKEPEKEEEKKETEKDEKKKSDSNAFIRMLRKLSFRKKKKGKVNDLDEAGAKGEKVETLSDDKAKSEKRFEERETRPQSLVMSSGRPPPAPGRPPIHPRTTPSSATANVSRPVSDLDSALRQFKLSTAESRESLRTLGSRQDLTQVEERVREAVGKSLSRSRQGSLRRAANGATSIPITLSVSLQELRANQ